MCGGSFARSYSIPTRRGCNDVHTNRHTIAAVQLLLCVLLLVFALFAVNFRINGQPTLDTTGTGFRVAGTEIALDYDKREGMLNVTSKYPDGGTDPTRDPEAVLPERSIPGMLALLAFAEQLKLGTKVLARLGEKKWSLFMQFPPVNHVFSLSVIYEVSGGNILEKSTVTKICAAERKLLNDAKYDDFCLLANGSCDSPNSICNYMFPETGKEVTIALPDVYEIDGTVVPYPNYLSAVEGGINALGTLLMGQRAIFCAGTFVQDGKTVVGNDCTVNNGKGTAVVDDPTQVFVNLYNTAATRTRTNFFFEVSFSDERPTSTVTRSTFAFGLPLEGYDNAIEKREEQKTKFGNWIKGAHDRLVKSDLGGAKIYTIGSVITDEYFNEVVLRDGFLAVFSVIFVIAYMFFHTRSFFLAIMGTFHIILALPLALFVYQTIANIQYFNTLNFLAFFVILGIGADDIFIFLDAWKQADHIEFRKRDRMIAERAELAATLSKEELEDWDERNDLMLRMDWAYRRSAKAMFITSFTSGAAFFANVISIIPPIRYFGIFTGLLVIFNFLLVITWYPAVVIIHDRARWTLRHGTARWYTVFLFYAVGLCFSVLEARKPSKRRSIEVTNENASHMKNIRGDQDTDIEMKQTHHEEPGAVTAAASVDLSSFRYLERFFYGSFVTFTNRYRYVILGIAVVLFGGALALAVQIKPAEDTTRFLPADDPVQRALDLQADVFAQSSYVTTLSLLWGVRAVDKTGVGPSETGKPIFDDAFSLRTAEEQQHIIDVCEKAKESPYALQDPATGKGQVLCFMEDYKKWRVANGLSFPVPAEDFDASFKAFATEKARVTTATGGSSLGGYAEASSYGDTMRFSLDSGKLVAVQVLVNTTVALNDPYSRALPAYEWWKSFAATESSNGPASLRSLCQTTLKWVRIETESALLGTAAVGGGVSVALAFVVLLLSTGNYIVALISVLCIIAILACVVGMLVALGWTMGIIESICLTITVGLSVDYVVHLANAYNESLQPSRLDRLRGAMLELGISVLSASFTTLGSAIILVFCTVTFFVRFGVFIVVDIFFSALFAFLAFSAIISLIGPSGSKGDIAWLKRSGSAKE